VFHFKCFLVIHNYTTDREAGQVKSYPLMSLLF